MTEIQTAAARVTTVTPDTPVDAIAELLATLEGMESWRPVVGHERTYEVSDLGRVRSITRVDAMNHRRRGRVLTPFNRYRQGRPACRQIGIFRDGVKKIRRVHSLVLEAFVGPKPAGMECCHGNGNPFDNRLSNLRWDTQTSNQQDAVRHGTKNPRRGEACGKAKLTTQQVREIHRRSSAGVRNGVLARTFGVSDGTINLILKGKNWRAVFLEIQHERSCDGREDGDVRHAGNGGRGRDDAGRHVSTPKGNPNGT